jgi:putative FmdB family regulatory protein
MCPVYDYECADCQTKFEVFYASFSAVDIEEPTERCPKCDSVKKERLISTSTSFQLKGRGWARDNYSGGGRKKD